MESVTTSTTTMALLTVTKALNRRLCKTFLSQRLLLARRTTSFATCAFQRPTLCASDPPIRRRLQCVPTNHASFSSGGGGNGNGGASGGDDGGGGGGDNAKSKVVASGEVSALSGDVIMLDVGGMSCGGCAASVKQILESQPEVSSASVNLTTEVAIVWPVSEAKLTPNWQKQLGETLAKHLTNCGFKSNIRVAGQEPTEGDISL